MISTILLSINFVLYLFSKPLLFGFINFWWIFPLEIAIEGIIIWAYKKIFW
jgi:hypothetical protein